MKHVTIKDVARALKVAPSTVSRAMNNASDISQNTRAKVLKKAREMGYRPNPVARNLHLRKTYQVGVVIPEFVNEFFPGIIMGMQQVLQAEGYRLLIMQSNECEATERENVLKLEENMVDGLMVSLSSGTQNIEHYNHLFGLGMPMVFFNRVNERLHAPKVVFHDFKWSYFATEHLIGKGCKKLLHLAGYKHLSLSRERIRGFEKALNKFHIEYTDGQIVETGFSIAQGEQVMQSLLREGIIPDGIFAANDPVAMGAIKAMQAAGLSVPEQVKVVGFSEASWSSLVSPSLTTVAQPTQQIGREAAHLLLKQIQGSGSPLQDIQLDGKLIKRESTEGKLSVIAGF